LADIVKQMYDQGLPIKQIAKALTKNRSSIAEALNFAFERAGLPKRDGRSRRASLSQKHLEPPLHQKIALEVKRLMDEKLTLGEIATALGCDRHTISRAIKFLYKSQNLPVPDGLGVVLWDSEEYAQWRDIPQGLEAEARSAFLPFEQCDAALKALLLPQIEPLLQPLRRRLS
jgi:DNA invertase Pin-like site-specific DNA recombinase